MIRLDEGRHLSKVLAIVTNKNEATFNYDGKVFVMRGGGDELLKFMQDMDLKDGNGKSKSVRTKTHEEMMEDLLGGKSIFYAWSNDIKKAVDNRRKQMRYIKEAEDEKDIGLKDELVASFEKNLGVKKTWEQDDLVRFNTEDELADGAYELQVRIYSIGDSIAASLDHIYLHHAGHEANEGYLTYTSVDVDTQNVIVTAADAEEIDSETGKFATKVKKFVNSFLTYQDAMNDSLKANLMSHNK